MRKGFLRQSLLTGRKEEASRDFPGEDQAPFVVFVEVEGPDGAFGILLDVDRVRQSWHWDMGTQEDQPLDWNA
ncbi:hypothetical protein GCM10010317_091140 [Streptomyces mirabilis]|nr:hypothetical protein GCM10010317_091140 [Streptomyces mirabilis]